MSQSAIELYQSVVLEHNRAPRGYGELSGATHSAEGFNPICGDKVTVQVTITSNVVSDVMFTAQCCALCRASASVMASIIPKNSVEAAKSLVSVFEGLLRGESATASKLLDSDAKAFFAIKEFPARAKCVLLPWRTLHASLSDQQAVSTESKE